MFLGLKEKNKPKDKQITPKWIKPKNREIKPRKIKPKEHKPKQHTITIQIAQIGPHKLEAGVDLKFKLERERERYHSIYNGDELMTL